MPTARKYHVALKGGFAQPDMRHFNDSADVRRIREDKARTLPIAEWKPLEGIVEDDGKALITEAFAWFGGINLVFWGCVMVWRYFL